MNASIKRGWLKFVLFGFAAVSFSALSVADETDDSSREKLVKERRLSTISKTQSAVEGFESVEMFSAISSGDIEVLIRTKDAADANLLLTNNSDRPLAIEMPATFSAVPVMRQFGGGGGNFGGGGGGQFGGGGGQFGGGLGGQSQGIGGGFGGGQGGGGFGGGRGGGGGGFGGGGGGGVFNIPPGRSGRLQVKTVCLEEGKPDPRARIDYVVQPLENLNSDGKIAEMCRMLASDEIAQPVAQAAAWHVTDNLSWDELLVKNRIERMDRSFVRYFHPEHVRIAQMVVNVAAERAEARAKFERESEQSKSDYESESKVSTVEQ
jgi:hypothetical protein